MSPTIKSDSTKKSLSTRQFYNKYMLYKNELNIVYL